VTLVRPHLFIVMEINTHTDSTLSVWSFRYIFVIRILDGYAPLYLISKTSLQKKHQGSSNIKYIVIYIINYKHVLSKTVLSELHSPVTWQIHKPAHLAMWVINSVLISGSFERVERLKDLGTTLMNQSSIQEEIKRDWSQGMLAIIWCRIFCLPVCYPKIQRLRYTEL